MTEHNLYALTERGLCNETSEHPFSGKSAECNSEATHGQPSARSIDYRTAAWQLNISPVALLKKLREHGDLYSNTLQRNNPRPHVAHLFDTETTTYHVGKSWRIHTMLLVRPAGLDYLRALLAGDTAHAKQIANYRPNPALAHQKIAEIAAQVHT